MPYLYLLFCTTIYYPSERLTKYFGFLLDLSVSSAFPTEELGKLQGSWSGTLIDMQ